MLRITRRTATGLALAGLATGLSRRSSELWVENPDFPPPTAATAAQDLKRVRALFDAHLAHTYPELAKRIGTERNKAWVSRIDAMLTRTHAAFVCVGICTSRETRASRRS